MVTADLPLTTLTVRTLTGVRQRVFMMLMAATLALVTQPGPADPAPDGAQGHLNVTVEISGERFRLVCQGSGGATVLFLESGGTGAASAWMESQAQVATFARACTLFATTARGHTALMATENAERIAGDIGRILGEQQVPAPYVIVAAANLAPIAVSLVEGNAGLVNGALVIEPASQSMSGWIVQAGSASRSVSLGTVDEVIVHIRSLIWPPRSI